MYVQVAYGHVTVYVICICNMYESYVYVYAYAYVCVHMFNSNATQPASAGLLKFMRRAAHCGFPQLAYLLSTSNSSRRGRSTLSWLRNKVSVEWQ